jgi:hypothetical protein
MLILYNIIYLEHCHRPLAQLLQLLSLSMDFSVQAQFDYFFTLFSTHHNFNDNDHHHISNKKLSISINSPMDNVPSASTF